MVYDGKWRNGRSGGISVKLKYKVMLYDNSEIFVNISTENVLDGHYQIYSQFGRNGTKNLVIVER